jgi:hypothetical protein
LVTSTAGGGAAGAGVLSEQAAGSHEDAKRQRASVDLRVIILDPGLQVAD